MTCNGGQAKTEIADQKIRLRFIIDRSSIEDLVNEGGVSISKIFYPDPAYMKPGLTASGGPIKINNLEVYRLQSIWLKQEQELGYFRSSLKN